MTPGSNILNMALGLIGRKTVMWRAFAGRTQNALGNWVVTYAADVPLSGSWQSDPTDRVTELGFDTSKTYRRFWASAPVDAVNRGTSPDLLIADGRKYEVVSTDDWIVQDGWVSIICVDIGPAT